MRLFAAIGLLALPAVGALAFFVRSGLQEPAAGPAAAPRPVPQAAASRPHCEAETPLPPLPEGYALPPLEALSVRAEATRIPLPPALEGANEDRVKDYQHRMMHELGRRPEQAELIRDLVWRYRRDVREENRKALEKASEQRRAAHRERREAARQSRLENAPSRPEAGPERAPRPPQVPPPELGEPVLKDDAPN